MKRIVSLLLAIVMTIGIFTGCGKETKKASGKLTVGIPQSSTVEDYDNNAFTKYLIETTGAQGEGKQRKNRKRLRAAYRRSLLGYGCDA